MADLALSLKAELWFKDAATNSDKIYKLELQPALSDALRQVTPMAIEGVARAVSWNVHFLYGRRGGSLKGGLKNSRPIGYDSARALFLSLAREKVNKGYRFTSVDGNDAEVRGLMAQYGAWVPDRDLPEVGETRRDARVAAALQVARQQAAANRMARLPEKYARLSDRDMASLKDDLASVAVQKAATRAPKPAAAPQVPPAPFGAVRRRIRLEDE